MLKRKIGLIVLTGQILIANNHYGALEITANWLLTLYKRLISPLQGQRICNFSPTCSQFSRQAIERYGFFPGLLMTADRLQRCNPSAWQYLDTYYFGLKDDRIFDPPENHYLFSPEKFLDTPSTETKEQIWLEPSSVQNFADYLFNSNDLVRATTEYEKLYFLATDKKEKQYAHLMLGECYLGNGEFDKGLLLFSNLDDSNLLDLKRYNLARSYFGLSEYERARQILATINDPNLRRQTQILIGWSYFKERNFAAGAMTFYSFSTDSLLNRLTEFDGKNLSRRSRWLSTAFSAIVPGLGQIYSGRIGDGLYSLLTIATTATLSYYYWQNPEKDRSRIKLSLFAFLTGLFWAGNIYGANIAARDYNEYQIRRYLTRIERILNSIDLKPDYRFLLAE